MNLARTLQKASTIRPSLCNSQIAAKYECFSMPVQRDASPMMENQNQMRRCMFSGRVSDEHQTCAVRHRDLTNKRGCRLGPNEERVRVRERASKVGERW